MLRFLGMKSASLCLGSASIALDWKLLLLERLLKRFGLLVSGRGVGGARVHLCLAQMGLFPLFFLHFPPGTHNQPVPGTRSQSEGGARLFQKTYSGMSVKKMFRA